MLSPKAAAALQLHSEGYNCAQSVARVFADDFGLAPENLLRLTSCFGGGMRMGSTCGALTAALMVLGLAKGFDTYSPEAKTSIEQLTQSLIQQWKSIFGVTNCREILSIDVSDPEARQTAKEQGIFEQHCPDCISTAVLLVETMLLLDEPIMNSQLVHEVAAAKDSA
jgi:C_GCAxxG_C_C family probable redox protein